MYCPLTIQNSVITWITSTPKELEIKDTTDSAKSASYLDLLLEIDEEEKLMTKLYDKRNDLSFQIVNFPFLCGNIPSAPAYGSTYHS